MSDKIDVARTALNSVIENLNILVLRENDPVIRMCLYHLNHEVQRARDALRHEMEHRLPKKGSP